MKYRYLLAFTLIAFSQCIHARSTTDKIANTAAVARLMGNIVWSQMYLECKEPSADIWDVEEKERNSIQCITIFKQAGQQDELNNFKKYDREASAGLRELHRELKIERVAAGGPPEKPDGCDAHHIVPQRDGRAWAKEFVDSAREILKECNIGINSAENGIYLPNGKKLNSECEGIHHPAVHTKHNYEKLSELLKDAKINNGCDGVRDTLLEIKNSLLRGVF